MWIHTYCRKPYTDRKYWNILTHSNIWYYCKLTLSYNIIMMKLKCNLLTDSQTDWPSPDSSRVAFATNKDKPQLRREKFGWLMISPRKYFWVVRCTKRCCGMHERKNNSLRQNTITFCLQSRERIGKKGTVWLSVEGKMSRPVYWQCCQKVKRREDLYVCAGLFNRSFSKDTISKDTIGRCGRNGMNDMRSVVINLINFYQFFFL